MGYGARPIGKFVLIKQVMRKKTTKIIMDAAESNKDKFHYSFEIVQLGNKCEADIKVGEQPIFSEYVKFSGVLTVEQNDYGMISILLVHEDDIIGIDTKNPQLNIDPPTKLVVTS